MNDFSQNASAFNCGLIAFEKLDMGSVPPCGFHGNSSTVSDDNCL